MSVPNKLPTIVSARRVALIGEAPGESETFYNEPFCPRRTPTNPYAGASGRLLSMILNRPAISQPREACFLGNICQERPPGNQLHLFKWDGPEIQESLVRLKSDLDAFKPQVIVLMGNLALKAAMDPDGRHPLTANAYRNKISNWRGSVLDGNFPNSIFAGYRCVPCIHPANALRSSDETPLVEFDLRKAVSVTNGYKRIHRDFVIPTTLAEQLALLDNVQQRKQLVATDIEGYWNNLKCIAFALSPSFAFIVPFVRRDGSRYWSAVEEPIVWRKLATVLEDPRVGKVWQNGLYDRFALAYGHRIYVKGNVADTMLKWWEMYAELPKALSMQTSILTDVPYYKGDIKSDDDATFYRYCCMDAAVTYEINSKLDTVLPASSANHSEFNQLLHNALLFMELQGIAYDLNGARTRRTVLQNKMYEEQAKLNGLTGRRLPSPTGLFNRAREIYGYKSANIPDWDTLARNTYAGKGERTERLCHLVRQPLTLQVLGEIEDLCEVSLNTSSSDQFIPFLYEELKLPPQYKETKDKAGNKTKALTGDYEALLKLSKHCQREGLTLHHRILQHCITIRALDTRQRMLGIECDPDGRVRCGYNIVGSDTGRVQCYTSPSGSGYALQTIPDYSKPDEAPGGVLGDRDLFLADAGHKWLKGDLKGADGWTVAAYSAFLGDPTMLEDYRYGLSPFEIMVLILRGTPGVDYRDRESIKAAITTVKKTDWDRFAMKRVQHGASYLEGGLTISNNILKDSEGKLFIEPSECARIRDQVFFTRYWGIRKWHDWVARRIKERPELTAASGQVRKFFGRTDEILPKAIAFEPQSNTTYVLNLALRNLWLDRENRRPDGGLFIRPCHHVHDELNTQAPTDRLQWAIEKFRSYFQNKVRIAGVDLVIPFDGAYGTAWGKCDEGKI